ncbi:hypothetical protein E3N88_28967 [Mikania micrantha]|uniref:Transposase-associated domain-containing protein n=1 Tax=Mikania micrantha TaxID=192012 RepID=A0A5N6N205_9ASTR|nr:hypothetical protein E3N88_28967 [Mikania micrantha]
MHNGSVSSIDKSWITHPNRKSDEYQQGLVSFIEMCKDFVDSRGYVRCAWARCQNSILIPFIKMKYHMHAYGICRTYRRWTHHDESLSPAVVVADDVTPTTDDVIPTNDMAGVIEDVMEERMEEDPNHDEVTGVQNVDNDLAEDLDVVHNKSSSNSVLFIDLSQYFQTRSTHVSNNEAASEVNPPAVVDDEDEMFQGEFDYDEDDPNYNTERSEIGTEDYGGESD